jgi:hypothetical protein
MTELASERYRDDESTGEFRAISPARCQELLASQSVGRVAWQAADGPQILPVTYAWYEGTIIFRTSPHVVGGWRGSVGRRGQKCVHSDNPAQGDRASGRSTVKVAAGCQEPPDHFATVGTLEDFRP